MLRGGERDVVVLAGGQTLVPRMIRRAVTPRLVVDIKRIAALGDVQTEPGGGARIGPLVSHERLRRSDAIRQEWPLLTEACGLVSNPAIRCRGTVGGSIAWGDGRSEVVAALLALDADVVATSAAAGSRRIGAADALRPDELITEVVMAPARGPVSSAMVEIGARRWDPALAGAACQLTWDEKRRVPLSARVVAFGELAHPRRMAELEAAITAGADAEACAHAAHEDAASTVDAVGVGADRPHVAAVIAECARRAVRRALAPEKVHDGR
jgi:carbon-monoxide dehydrogenase medium subunit